MRVLVPVEGEGANMRIASHFGSADYYIVFRVDSDSCEKIGEYSVRALERGRGRAISEWAMGMGVDAAVVMELGVGAYNHLLSAGIRVYRATSESPCAAAIDVARGSASVLGDEMLHRHRHEHHWH